MEYFTELTEKLAQISKGEMQEDSIKFYQNNYQSITYFVKVLKREQSSHYVSNIKDMDLTSLSQLLMNFMCQKKAFESPLFLQALAAFDCILSYIPTILCKLNHSENFSSNLRKYFIKICQKYQDFGQKERQRSMQFEFYSVFYIIVMTIYQSGKCQNDMLKKMPLQIMNKCFLASLFEMDIPSKSRVQKLIGFIMVYLAKRISLRTWGKRMFKFIITECQNVQNRRTIFNFIFCIREINVQSPITLQEIQKHNLLAVLRKIWYKFSQQYQIIYLIDLVERLLKNYPTQSKNFLTEDVVEKLGSPTSIHLSHPLYTDIVLNILKCSQDFTSHQFYKKIVYLNLPTMKQSQISMRIINSFFHLLPSQDIIGLIKNGFVNEIQYLLNSFDDVHKYQGMQILQRLLNLTAKLNEQISSNIYYKMKKTLVGVKEMIEMKSSVERLERIYQKRSFQINYSFNLN